MSDINIIDIVKEKKGVLITEDKDFGELVFAYNIRSVSVIFFRYDQPKYHMIEDHLLKAVRLFYENDTPVFITVTENKIRIRRL
jgi:predicted nuclease of predicted toxin-antitoxin system